jgi:uncharacterized membrane protein
MSNQDQELVNDAEWAKPENWTRFNTYRSARDNRFWVPKKNPRLGWTINFAHRGAWWAMLAPAIVPTGLLLGLVLHYFFE